MSNCKIKECDRPVVGWGMCHGHWKRWRQGRPISNKPLRKWGTNSIEHKTPEYRAWAMAKNRCKNKNNIAYRNYGARGITMCKKWEKCYASFLKDMGRRPSPGHSLDRINNNKNYSPRNCKWSTRDEQNKNRRPRSQWTKK